jgi:hypothetical protein
MRSAVTRAIAVSALIAFVTGAVWLNDVAILRAGAQPRDSTPQFSWFYRFRVELAHEDEPLAIEVVIACGSQVRSIPGEGRSARAIWAPYIFGVRVGDGHGVLVQSPAVCDRDVAKNPIPADFLPIVFWAPDANNLEFFIAYLHERAYEQPLSKLKFQRATVVPATEAEYRDWRETIGRQNIVPIGAAASEYEAGASFFRGEGFFPEGDPRNSSLVRLECHSYIRLPLPEFLRATLRKSWPVDRPQYWLLDWVRAQELQSKHVSDIRKEAKDRGLSDTSDIVNVLEAFMSGLGIKRPSGVGHLGLPNRIAPGEALRIPYRVTTGYPWAKDALVTETTIDLYADTARGADHGFAYCFRDVAMAYLRDPKTRQLALRKQRFFIDGQLIGTREEVRATAPAAVIVERDEYLWHHTKFPLTHELARMQ